jgi:hypothetical protein
VRPLDRNNDVRGPVHFDATCHHRRPATSYMVGLTDCLRPMRGGSQSRGDTWCPQSCPEPGGGYHSTPLPRPSMGGQGVVPSRSGRHCLYLAATLLGLSPPLHDFNDHDHLNINYLDIKGLSSACGTRRFSTPVTAFAPS